MNHDKANGPEPQEATPGESPSDKALAIQPCVSRTTQENPLVLTLRRIDPILQFLTKATGLTAVPLSMLQRALPAGYLEIRETDKKLNHEIPRAAILDDLESLIRIGVIHLQQKIDTTAASNTTSLSWDDESISIGFPPPEQEISTIDSSQENAHWLAIRKRVGNMSASTKTGAKKRLRALQLYLNQCHGNTENSTKKRSKSNSEKESSKRVAPLKIWEQDENLLSTPPMATLAGEHAFLTPTNDSPHLPLQEETTQEATEAIKALRNLMGFPKDELESATVEKDCGETNEPAQAKSKTAQHSSSRIPTCILPRQVSHAGSQAAQSSEFGTICASLSREIPDSIWNAFGLHPRGSQGELLGVAFSSNRYLYQHQVQAIESALSRKHTTVCTGTGSGKSLCFLLPILTAAYNSPHSLSVVLFPTKALAQDQLQKLNSFLEKVPDLQGQIRIAALDGDTLHSERTKIVKSAPNILLTNPDTLHAAILPGWKKTYKTLFANRQLCFVALDEAHLYEGVFGSHVALILARLLRIASINCPSGNKRTTFFASSATMPFPLEHFRRLFPIDAQKDPVTIVTRDTSPRSAKHFFTWNPPLMSKQGGEPLHRVTFARPKQQREQTEPSKKKPRVEDNENTAAKNPGLGGQSASSDLSAEDMENQCTACAPQLEKGGSAASHGRFALYRRHAADETALLFVKAIQNGTRCIAFAKTRNLVEWIYEKALAALGGDSDLRSKIESYRGGYSRFERKKIEARLFSNDLIGVVATNALELGVDIGGVDLTLHCGFPTSLSSLYQQAGRAGRGTNIERSSCAIVICFNSPIEQYLWKYPHILLAKGASSSTTIPMSAGLVQGHLLCASEESPLTGSFPATTLCIDREREPTNSKEMLSDHDLFGGEELYEEALDQLKSSSSISQFTHRPANGVHGALQTYTAHPFMKKAWSRISIRSIEPIHFSIVDLSHPQQGGQMDSIHENAVLDVIPFSRVFYHCHPGAIISHRGSKYKIVSMTRPPAFAAENFYRRNHTLASFARPTSARYTTRPLSTMQITVIKQMERVDFPKAALPDKETPAPSTGFDDELAAACSFAGCGAVSVKRTVHGYKKLSLINRTEIGRSELSMPDMEFDTFGLWIDTDAGTLRPLLGDKYGEGVHALEHALLAVAPLYAPGLVRTDLECDHNHNDPTRIVLFDERAGSSGATSRLWKSLFKPNNILEAAIKLLESCASCGWDRSYDGGCPACLLAPECLKFNMHLSRKAASVIGKHMLERLQRTDMYKRNVALANPLGVGTQPLSPSTISLTPRRRARKQALRQAKEMHPARDRQYMVGRPSWPFENPNEGRSQELA